MPIDLPAIPCPAMPHARLQVSTVAQAGVDGLRLGTVASLRGMPEPLRGRAAGMVLPWRVSRPLELPVRALVAAMRAQMPILACAAVRGDGPAIRIRPAPRPSAAPRHAAAPDDGVKSGDRLSLTTLVGPVRVERSVTAVQAARPGGRLFVRDSNAQILSVRYAVAAR